jgi:ribosomal protein L7/L12
MTQIQCISKYTAVISLACIGMLFSACSGGDEKNNQIEIVEDFFEFQKFNLKDFGLNATIMLPDETANIGASTRPEVKHAEDGFKWEIEVGPNFHMIIDDFGEEKNKVADKKRKLKELDIFETKFLVDEKDFIIYESTLKVDGEKASPITDPKPHVSYHVYGQKVIDGYTYVFRSREEGYPKNIIDLMAKSIKSVQEVKNS